jgi:ribosomal protein L29
MATKIKDIRDKSEQELVELVERARKTVQEERFKDKFSRKAGVIRAAKREVAQAMTVLTERQSEKK